MNELQSRLLIMLKWFDAFCRLHGLTYYAVGGTLLGAVRHKGFIPWDDDVDLGMPRKDYERLESLMENKQFENYKLETYKSSCEDYCYPYDKLYDVSTTLIENYRRPLKRGVFLDIFPIDGAGETEKESVAWCKQVNNSYYFYLTRIAAISKHRKAYKNVIIVLSRLIPSIFIDDVEYRIKLNEKCKKYEFATSNYAGNLLGNWGIKEVVPTKVIGKPTDYQFEDMKIYGIEHFDSYLTHIYGDWRKLPPKEKQVSHHDYLSLNLDKSYTDTAWKF